MEERINTAILVLSLMALVFSFIYFVIPRVEWLNRNALFIKAVLFFAGVIYISIDFMMQGKYVILLPVAMGSMAFLKIIADSVKKSDDGDSQ
jgi:uncharacterized BrkB/YihY/UPF0761 family membrane protein